MKKKPDTITAMLCIFFIALAVSTFSGATRSAETSGSLTTSPYQASARD